MTMVCNFVVIKYKILLGNIKLNRKCHEFTINLGCPIAEFVVKSYVEKSA